MKLQNMRIGRRLALGFGLLGALLVVAVAAAVARVAALHDDFDRLLELQQRSGAADQWRAQAQLNATRAVAMAKSAYEPEVVLYFEPLMKPTSARIDALQKEIEAAIDSDKGQALTKAIAAQRREYVDVRKQVFTALLSGDRATGVQLLETRMLPLVDTYLGSIDALARYQEELAEAGLAETRAALARTHALLGGLLLLCLAAAATAAWLITRSVTRPLREAVAATEAIAEGDLTRRIDVAGRDETAELLAALARMQDRLRDVVGRIRAGTDSIGTASSQVAAGSQDLSTRTEQTASHLQQTASSVEEITQTLRQSSDSSAQANQLAAGAAGVARRGGEVVAQVVATMEEINASSRKIADITGVIDGIAFQTNILALNAAVEAARAGEQGRGFAVVAGEVRSLAQRSAEAAREIKTLIGTSVDKVEAGSRLVGDAGHTMQEIVASVQRVSDIIGEISAAATEQSQGIGQVNASVSQLDQMTQQNAALVEQSAAAAASLKEQAGRLAEAVAAFRLAAPHADATPTPPAPPRAAAASTALSPGAASASVPAAPRAAPAARAPAPAPAAAARRVIDRARRAPGDTPQAAPPAAPARAPAPAPAAADDGDWETF
jgi:methyl-accepting chemotaxis protein